jgi:hypothetical protein
MSRGAGNVQRRLIAALDELGRRFTVEELAEIAFQPNQSNASTW